LKKFAWAGKMKSGCGKEFLPAITFASAGFAGSPQILNID